MSRIVFATGNEGKMREIRDIMSDMEMQVVSMKDFDFEDIEPAVAVEVTYTSGLSGSNIMLLKRHDVKVICELLMGFEMSDEEFELNEMNLSAICEVMNQMMGASATALSEFLEQVVNISTPTSFEVPDIDAFKDKYFNDGEDKVAAVFRLKIQDAIESRFVSVMSLALAKELLSAFNLELQNESYVDGNLFGRAFKRVAVFVEE